MFGYAFDSFRSPVIQRKLAAFCDAGTVFKSGKPVMLGLERGFNGYVTIVESGGNCDKPSCMIAVLLL